LGGHSSARQSLSPPTRVSSRPSPRYEAKSVAAISGHCADPRTCARARDRKPGETDAPPTETAALAEPTVVVGRSGASGGRLAVGIRFPPSTKREVCVRIASWRTAVYVPKRTGAGPAVGSGPLVLQRRSRLRDRPGQQCRIFESLASRQGPPQVAARQGRSRCRRWARGGLRWGTHSSIAASARAVVRPVESSTSTCAPVGVFLAARCSP
jgi:hypothetical protein